MSEDTTRRIQTVRRGRLEPLIAAMPLLSSATKADWRGITLEKHLADANYVSTDFEVYSDLIHIFTGVPAQSEWRVEGRTHRVQNIAASILIEPKGLHASVRVCRSQRDIQWILEFNPALIEQRIQEALNSKRFEFIPQFDLRDPQVLRLTQALQADVEAGCPAGSLFGEMLGDTLAVYLIQRCSADSLINGPTSNGLSRPRLNRTLEYIQANLDRDIHLDELASAAGLSAYHFAKLFKQSTGSSPHQYILQRRLERAKELLRDPELSLSEVSLLAGFSDQSHLTNVFRRLVGVTPSKFRALL